MKKTLFTISTNAKNKDNPTPQVIAITTNPEVAKDIFISEVQSMHNTYKDLKGINFTGLDALKVVIKRIDLTKLSAVTYEEIINAYLDRQDDRLFNLIHANPNVDDACSSKDIEVIKLSDLFLMSNPGFYFNLLNKYF